jgi:HTH-type transcriptional regulator/antitoxin HigA
MIESQIILNEREAGRARASLIRIREALSASSTIETAKSGLSIAVLESHRKAIAAVRNELSRSLEEYEQAKRGNFAHLVDAWRTEPGVMLIVARIVRGMSQADLAEKLGLREQQIQRYEADRYRSISLSNYRRIASLLGLEIAATVKTHDANWSGTGGSNKRTYSDAEVLKVASHAKTQKWFDVPADPTEQYTALMNYVGDSNGQLAVPALLRTGLSAKDLSQDLSLIAWRARIVRRVRTECLNALTNFDPLDIAWLNQLVRFSQDHNGPLKAQDFLIKKGVALTVEAQIPGLRLDGAALIVDGSPVVGMTLRYDRIDNFWFTLLHELAHIFLHHRAGLSAGFFDDLDMEQGDELEAEANEFASSALIPLERWKISPARISKSLGPIDDFARQLGIHPAIVFGRIRKERNNYKLFTDKLGNGMVRSLFETT